MKNVDTKTTIILKMITVFIDFIIINFSFALFFLLANPLSIEFFSLNFLLCFAIVNIGWQVCARVFKLYFTSTFFEVEEVYRSSVKTVCLYILLLYIPLLLTKSIDKQINIFSISLLTLFCISRFYLTYLTEFVMAFSKFKRKIAIIGYNEAGVKLAQYFSNKSKVYSFSGFFDDYSDYTIDNNGEIVGTIDNCIDYVLENNVTEIYSTLNPAKFTNVDTLIKAAEKHCVRVKFVGDAQPEFFEGSSVIDFIHEYPITGIRKEPLEYMGKRIKKRIFDIAISSFAIVFVLSWLIPLIAILVKLESRGPVLFFQQRAGRNNKIFNIIKLRTMMVAEKNAEFKQAIKNDPRVTRLGKLLRKLSFDELPQFMNVLLGDMSFTGPRPHPIKLNESYKNSINNYMARHFVKPGITGWAQVNGYRGETESIDVMRKRIEYDMWYIENWTLMLDVKIFFMTIINFFKKQEKAY